jgi:hypothetical protein
MQIPYGKIKETAEKRNQSRNQILINPCESVRSV